MGHKIPIDLAKVRVLAGHGLTEAEICRALGISTKTLGRRKKDSSDVAEAINVGRAEAHALVANKLFELTQAGHLGAIVWYEKTRCGMKDRVYVEVDWRDKVIEAGYDPDDLFRVVIESVRNSATTTALLSDGSEDEDATDSSAGTHRDAQQDDSGAIFDAGQR